MERVFASLWSLVAAAVVLLFAGVSAQAVRSSEADADRDLQGFWALNTVTPLERPADLAGKPFFTEQEARDWEVNSLHRAQDRAGVEGRTSPEFNGVWGDLGRKVLPSRRTSLIIDPPDGRIPFRPDAPPERPETFDDPEARPPSERCIVWTEGPPMTPNGVTGHLQIVQAPGYVVIVNEMIHDARIVPLDGRAHLPGFISRWTGDSRGRWDGDTLIVDTTNFNGTTRVFRSTAALHVVERFRRVDDQTLSYSYTVTDVATYTRPWTAEMVMTRTDTPLYEYACHEANYSLANILSGARAVEKSAGASVPK